MNKFLRDIDFISKEENLRIDKKNRYENVIGGILSLLIFLFSVLITIYFSIEMFFTKDPSVVMSKGPETDSHNYTITKDNIQFFISLEYSNATYYIDESVYNVYAKFTEIFFVREDGKTVQKFRTKEIKVKKCTDFYSQEEILRRNLKMPIQYFYCMDGLKDQIEEKDNEKDKEKAEPQIGGIWGAKYFSKVEIFVKKCNNETNTSSQPCKSNDEIDSIIENGIVSMYTTNHFIDNRDYNSPIKTTLKNNFDRLSNRFKMNYIITYSTNFYNNDLGWIFPSIYVTKFPTIEDFKISQLFGDKENIIQIQLQNSPIKYIYRRSYIKIQDILTKIGGCIKALLLMGMGLNYFYSYSFSIIDNVKDNHFDSLVESLEPSDIEEIIKKQPQKKFRIKINSENKDQKEAVETDTNKMIINKQNENKLNLNSPMNSNNGNTYKDLFKRKNRNNLENENDINDNNSNNQNNLNVNNVNNNINSENNPNLKNNINNYKQFKTLRNEEKKKKNFVEKSKI